MIMRCDHWRYCTDTTCPHYLPHVVGEGCWMPTSCQRKLWHSDGKPAWCIETALPVRTPRTLPEADSRAY